MKVAALQLASQSASNARLDYHLKIAAQKGACLAVCGEYVMNDFFTQLQEQSLEDISRQSRIKIEYLQDFSAQNDLQIAAPFILAEKNGAIKTILHFAAGKLKSTPQHILMPYTHWNEAKFFANKSSQRKKYKNFVVKINGMRVAFMPSFELHFDEAFAHLKADLLVVFCAHTFSSDERWRLLLRMRAFTHNINILRINRIGSAASKDGDWEFYGSSLLIDGHGDITKELGAGEELLIINVDKPSIASGFWRFERMRRELAKG